MYNRQDDSEAAMNDEEVEVFLGLLDGVEGYVAETGYPRYWDPDVIERARRLANDFRPRTSGADGE